MTFAAICFAVTVSVLSQNITPVNVASTGNVNYIDRIHLGDVIDIHVVGHLEYNWRGSLNPEGFLDGFDKIPNQIFALCRSEAEVSEAISSELSRILRSPKTEVRVVDRSRRTPAVMDGAVKTPQRVQLNRAANLNEIIIRSGGITDRASGEITIMRPAGSSCIETSRDGATKNISIKISDLLAGRADANPVVASGDLVVVNEALPVYFIGAVAAQGRLDHRPGLTLSRAIDAAGGLQKDAVSQVSIFKRNGTSRVVRADLERIRKGHDPDIELEPFDIVDIPYKGRPPRRLPPVLEVEPGAAERRARLPLLIIE